MGDFTEAAYRSMLRLALERYPCVRFPEHRQVEVGVLWRHDIDVSPHRALALARIEHEEGVHATYFVHLHSMFYNALEHDVVTRLQEIAALGHDVGVHFEVGFYAASAASATSAAELDRQIAAEAALIAQVCGRAATAVSFHNPPPVLGEQLEADELAGLVNVYGRELRSRFEYRSDSNGFWRHRSLADVLRSRAGRLQVLTHPEWWVPDSMPPEQRMARAVDGRSASVLRRYRGELVRTGRHES